MARGRRWFAYGLVIFFMGPPCCHAGENGVVSVVPNQLEVFPALPGERYKSDLYEVVVIQAGSYSPSAPAKAPAAAGKQRTQGGTKADRQERESRTTGKAVAKERASYVYKAATGREGAGATQTGNIRANHWTSFAFQGKATVRIKLRKGGITGATVRPLSTGIICRSEKGAVLFDLSRPGKFFVEIEGQDADPLFVFAEAMEPNPPKADSDSVAYFGPGAHEIGDYVLTKPQAYIDGGAFVTGTIRIAPAVKSCMIRGLGILSGSVIPPALETAVQRPLISAGPETISVHINGPTLIDSPFKNIVSDSKQLHVENVKIFGGSALSEGIGGASKTVTGCFIKTRGTAIFATTSADRLIRNTVFTENTAPVVHFGQKIDRNVSNILVNGMDIIGSDASKNPDAKSALFVLGNFKGGPGQAVVRHDRLWMENIHSEVENFRVFDFRSKGDFEVLNADGSRERCDQGLGVVEGATFKDFTFAKKPLETSVFNGNGGQGTGFRNLTFENIRIAGILLDETSNSDYIAREGHAEGFTYCDSVDKMPLCERRPVTPLRRKTLEIYPPLPGDRYRSDRYEVGVFQDGYGGASYVYQSDNDRECHPQHKAGMCLANHWTSFSFSGEVTVKVRLTSGRASSAVVRPRSRNVATSLSESGTLEFVLKQPGQYYIAMEGQERHPLFIFANPPEASPPTKNESELLYFGPGIHDIGKLEIQDKNIYIAGGAYVRGTITVNAGKREFRLGGYGIVSGIDISHVRNSWGGNHLLQVTAGETRVGGITFTDSPCCTMVINGRSDVSNVKIMSWESQTDGISSRGDGSVVSKSFLKTMDDSLQATGRDKKFIDLVLFQEEHGSLFQLSWGEAADFGNTLIDGVDVVGNYGASRRPELPPGRDAAFIASANINGTEGRGAVCSNLVVRNVRIDVRISQFASFEIKAPGGFGSFVAGSGAIANYSQGRGSIQGVTFENITLSEPPARKFWFNGNGTLDGSIRDVTFRNVEVAGIPLTDATADTFVARNGITDAFKYVWDKAEK